MNFVILYRKIGHFRIERTRKSTETYLLFSEPWVLTQYNFLPNICQIILKSKNSHSY